MERTIELCGRIVVYELKRKNVKNINLRIKPDGSVHVSAGQGVSLKRIEEFMRGKDRLICAALDRFELERREVRQPEEYAEGEPVWVAGELLKLRIEAGPGSGGRRMGDTLVLTVRKADDPESRRQAYERWQRQYCAERMTEICQSIYPLFSPYGVAFPALRFRRMRSRWGSCMPQKGKVTFNTALSGVPDACAEYVAVHEFAHFLQPDHSRKFYRLLGVFLPDWAERKKMLSQWAGKLV